MQGHHGIFQGRHFGKQADVLKGPGNSQGEDLVGALAQQAFSVQDHIACRCLINPCDNVEYGCLAGAVGTDQAHNFAGLQREIDFGEGLETAKRDADIVQSKFGHSFNISVRKRKCRSFSRPG